MQKSDIQALCERRFLELIKDYGLPEPDQIELTDAYVQFIWTEQKLVVQIDLAEFIDRDANAAFTRDGLAA
jgi:hypothetical protein